MSTATKRKPAAKTRIDDASEARVDGIRLREQLPEWIDERGEQVEGRFAHIATKRRVVPHESRDANPINRTNFGRNG